MEYTYEEFINNILETRGRFACGNEYHERHHIVPKCMNGSNNEDNLIDLFAREHFEAHRLLALENPDNSKLVYAWHRISCGGNDVMKSYILTPQEYEEMKKAYSKMRKKETTGVKQSKETVEKRVKQLRGKSRPESVKQTLRNLYTGRKLSKKTKEKISASLSGRPNPNKGKPMSNNGRLSLCKYTYYSPELNECFNSTGEIERKYGINHQNIVACINGKRKTSGKHPLTKEKLHWYYVNDVIKNTSVIHGAISLGLITEEEALKMLEQQEGEENDNEVQ